MRRGTVILSLVVSLLLGGLIALHIGSTGGIFRAVRDLPPNQLTAVALFFLAASAALVGQLSLRLSSGRLGKQVRDAVVSGSLNRVDRLHPDFAALADAVNEVMDTAEQTVGRAKLAVKELEIQLKVATAERQHAEAIIYSISDAVLVTDPFDELVLANESAARTFDFDLDKCSRTPVSDVLKDLKMIEMIQEMRQSNSRSGRRIVEHQVKTPVGGRTFKVTLSCVADQAGTGRDDQPTGVVAVLHDMTKEKEVAEMKNDFV